MRLDIIRYKLNEVRMMLNDGEHAEEQGILVDIIKELDKPESDDNDKWIPISKRLPEEATLVLVTCQDLYLHKLNPCIGWRNGQYWSTFCAKGDTLIQYPIAWQPLPKPYKVESEDKE